MSTQNRAAIMGFTGMLSFVLVVRIINRAFDRQERELAESRAALR